MLCFKVIRRIVRCDAFLAKPLVTPVSADTAGACCSKARDLQPLIFMMYAKEIPLPVNMRLFGVPISIIHVEG